MKKILLLSLMASCVISLKAQSFDSASRHNYTVQVNTIIGKSLDADFGGDAFIATAAYTYSLTPTFKIGGGLGLGSGNFKRAWSMTNLIDEDDLRGNSLVTSAFARVKVNFSKKATSLFLSGDIGYNSASLEAWNGEDYNALGVFFTPSAGCDIGLANGSKLVFAIGIQAQSIKYNDIKYKYENIVKKYLYDSFSLERGGFTGLFLSVGYSF